MTALHRPPRLDALKDFSNEWELILASPACGERLHDLAGFHTLTWLHLHGCDDLADLRELPARPRSLQRLSLFGFPELTTLDGIEQWDGLAAIELFDCPQLSEFVALAALASLQRISLGLFSEGSRDFSPIASLPQLKELSLMGNSSFDVGSLAGVQGLTVTVPAHARVTGADKLGPESRIITRTRTR